MQLRLVEPQLRQRVGELELQQFVLSAEFGDERDVLCPSGRRVVDVNSHPQDPSNAGAEQQYCRPGEVD